MNDYFSFQNSPSTLPPIKGSVATPEKPNPGFDKLENIEFIDQSTPADVTHSNVKGYHTIDTSQEQKHTSRLSSSSGDDVFKTLPIKQQKTKVSIFQKNHSNNPCYFIM